MLCDVSDICSSVINYCSKKISPEALCTCVQDNLVSFCNDSKYFYFVCVIIFICNVVICLCKINFFYMTDNTFQIKNKSSPYTENL